jgi:hypothetical protein
VSGPNVMARIEQEKHLAGDGVNAGQVWTFAQIAIVAGEGKVSSRSVPPCCRATMCSTWCFSAQAD